MEVFLSDTSLGQAAQGGAPAFVEAVAQAIERAAGGGLTAHVLEVLSPQQTTLLAYRALRDELMEGGWVQLIHNGWGPFFFRNPFAKAMRLWGVDGLASLVGKAHKLYSRLHEPIEADCTDEEFMALYERFPQFDALDDEFVEREEEFTRSVGLWVDAHLDQFVKIV